MSADIRKELLRQVAKGDENAFATLFHSFRKKLYTNIYKLTDSREMAEDTVSEVFLKIWIDRTSLTKIDDFAAYLGQMARNHAITGLRRMAKEALIVAELKREQNKDQTHPVQPMMASEVRDFIRKAIEKLTPQQKLVFLLSREEGLKHSEIAERLNISILTVKKHMGDALSLLRQELRGKYGSYAISLFAIHALHTSKFI